MFLQISIINEALTTLSTISAANNNNDNNFVSLDPETVSSVIKLKRIFHYVSGHINCTVKNVVPCVINTV